MSVSEIKDISFIKNLKNTAVYIFDKKKHRPKLCCM